MIRTAAIVGGGIGGLTAAIALAQRGWQVAVHERASEIAEVGAGVQISPNGTRILDALGVMPHLEATLFEPEFAEIRQGASEFLLLRLPLKGVAETRWGARYLNIHRADLVNGLLAVAGSLANIAVHLNSTISQVPDADLVIAADGVHSALRAQLFPEQPGAGFTGNVAWRALLPVAALGRFAPPPNACIWTGSGKHAVTTRVRRGELVNFVGIVKEDSWQQDGWSHPGARDEAQRLFGGWSPIVDAILEDATSFNRWALLDHPPLPQLHRDNVALIGDAAHPMLPSKAQGAVMAMEDAYVLAKLLDAHPLSQALMQYSQQRLPRVTRVQREAAANVDLFHRAGAPIDLTTYKVLVGRLATKIAPGLVLRRDDWLFGAKF